jgi:succinate dehydrogenase / fumarate reductase cytochrome b subunit
MADVGSSKVQRPMSPHLQVYRPMITMVMSIVHRITGAALYFGILLLVWWLLAVASGPQAYATVSSIFGSWLGLLVLFGFTWALVHHTLGGIRHFVWDLGHGYDVVWRNRLAWWTIIGSIALTLILWIIALAL